MLTTNPFGTTFFVEQPLPEKNKINFCLHQRARNWNPGKFVHALQLVAISIVNVVNCMKAAAGVPLSELSFPEPVDYAFFDEPEEYLRAASTMKVDPGYNPKDFETLALMKADVLAWYGGSAKTP